jgi:two-component system cell cycle response regulator
MTTLLNRRALLEQADRIHSLAREQPYGFILFDIDRFKNFNDQYGHQSGDEALIRVSDIICRESRGEDLVFRYGGEEIVVIVRSPDPEAVMQLAERIRMAISETLIKVGDEEWTHVTASAGVAFFDPASVEGWEALFKRADQALYLAKESGRNRCVRWAERAARATEAA